jgi:hypothetical protein
MKSRVPVLVTKAQGWKVNKQWGLVHCNREETLYATPLPGARCSKALGLLVSTM